MKRERGEKEEWKDKQSVTENKRERERELDEKDREREGIRDWERERERDLDANRSNAWKHCEVKCQVKLKKQQ